ncbi:MAG: FtsX-like permease family protein [Bryobacteraceae bacterium]
MCVVGLVLLITCANISNLLLACGSSRSRELALRRALGAGRRRIIRQLLTESVILAVIGGALGLLLANWGTTALARATSSGVAWRPDQQLILNLAPGARVLAFTVGLSLCAGILFGLAPAIRGLDFGGRGSPVPSLSQRSQASTGRLRLASLLVAVQVALSLVLVTGAGLLVRTLRNLASQDIGLDRERVMLVWTAIRQTGVQGGAPSARLFEDSQKRLAALPGVLSAKCINRRTAPGELAIPVSGEGPGLHARRRRPAHGATRHRHATVFRDSGDATAYGPGLLDPRLRSSAPCGYCQRNSIASFFWLKQPAGQAHRFRI